MKDDDYKQYSPIKEGAEVLDEMIKLIGREKTGKLVREIHEILIKNMEKTLFGEDK